MKILHTSDWHIGQTLRNYDREDEQRHFFRILADILRREKPDALVVAGDVFHTSLPTIGAQELLVEALGQLHEASPETVTVIIAGNHDSGSRLEIHRGLWRSLGIHIVGRPDAERCVVELPKGKGTVVAVPFMSRVQFTSGEDGQTPMERQRAFIAGLLDKASGLPGPVAMCAHMALTGKGETGSDDTDSYNAEDSEVQEGKTDKEGFDAANGGQTDTVGGLELRSVGSVPEGYDYLALGHIHFPHSLSSRAAYSGSPIPMNFDEGHKHYVNIVEIATRGAEPQVRRIEIEPLRGVLTVEAGSPEEAIEKLSELSENCSDYVRAVIDAPGLLPADIDDRGRLALEGKKCRFCGCFVKPRAYAGTRDEEEAEMEIDDFLRVDPIEIARRYFADENEPEAEKLLGLLEGVVDKLKEEGQI